MKLAGQEIAGRLAADSEKTRKLGAQLLLSEVLEYVIHGLGVVPEFNGTAITEPNMLGYTVREKADAVEMVDGLADVAYTMFWNACAFGVPLEEAFALVCGNNLDKFIKLQEWNGAAGPMPVSNWSVEGVSWPPEVVQIEIIQCNESWYAVGKDAQGKVRKPSTYAAVELEPLVARAIAGNASA